MYHIVNFYLIICTLICSYVLPIHNKFWIDDPINFFVGNDFFIRCFITSHKSYSSSPYVKGTQILFYYIQGTQILLIFLSNNFVFFLKRWNLKDKKLKDQLIKDLKHEFCNIFKE